MKNLISGLLVGVILLFVVINCGGGKPVPSQYQGNWVGKNGTTIYMSQDGKAGFAAGSKTVTGGSAEIDESAKTLTISLFGISETWKIDEEPNNAGEMKLSGVIFKRN